MGHQRALEEEQQLLERRREVFGAIARVQSEMASVGVSKSRTNESQRYQFRGIDDVYNAMASVLAKHGLCIIPHYTDRIVTERAGKSGGALFYVTVCGHFDLIAASDGSKITAGPFYGEAMDSGDKATNKAMSAAMKYFLFQTFVIPTQGDNDADSTTHEPAALTAAQLAALQTLRDASLNGMVPLAAAWNSIGKEMRIALEHEMPALKKAASLADGTATRQAA
jgi:hypothetical protein